MPVRAVGLAGRLDERGERQRLLRTAPAGKAWQECLAAHAAPLVMALVAGLVATLAAVLACSEFIGDPQDKFAHRFVGFEPLMHLRNGVQWQYVLDHRCDRPAFQ